MQKVFRRCHTISPSEFSGIPPLIQTLGSLPEMKNTDTRILNKEIRFKFAGFCYNQHFTALSLCGAKLKTAAYARNIRRWNYDRHLALSVVFQASKTYRNTK